MNRPEQLDDSDFLCKKASADLCDVDDERRANKFTRIEATFAHDFDMSADWILLQSGMAPAKNLGERHARIIELLSSAKDSMYALFEEGNKRDESLKSFEEQLLQCENKFKRFDLLTVKYEKQAKGVEAELTEELAHQGSTINKLKGEIKSLSVSIERQSAENKQLERDLKNNAENFSRRKNWDASKTVKYPNIIERLRKEHPDSWRR